FVLARYLPSGMPDPSFGDGTLGPGVVVTSLNVSDYVNALGQQPDGKVIAAGSTAGSGIIRIGLARYLNAVTTASPTQTASPSQTPTSSATRTATAAPTQSRTITSTRTSTATRTFTVAPSSTSCTN